MLSSSPGTLCHSEQSKRTTRFERKANEQRADSLPLSPTVHIMLAMVHVATGNLTEGSRGPLSFILLTGSGKSCLLQQAIGPLALVATLTL